MIENSAEKYPLTGRTKALLAAAFAGSALGMALSLPHSFLGSSAHGAAFIGHRAGAADTGQALSDSLTTKNNNNIIATNEKQIVISAVGDCVLGTDDRFLQDVSFNHYRNVLHEPDSYFFGGVKDIFEHDDLTIANSECVISNASERVRKPPQEGGQFWFHGDPDNARIFAAGGVEAVNIANNHSFDYGDQGLKDTVDNLQRCGVAPFGCGIKQIIIRKGIRIGLAGYAVMGPLEQGVDENALEAQISSDLAAMSSSTDLRIVTFHWGVETLHTATAQQQRLGHFAVDHGANLVLGHHPHVLQPIETYKGVPIVYSLGNFVYGGSARVSDRSTMIYQHTFRFSEDNRIIGQSSKVIPCLVYDAASNDYRPVVAPQSNIQNSSETSAASSHPSPPEGKEAERINRGSLNETMPSGFVDVKGYVPDAVVDLRYATEDNPYQHRFYNTDNCFLRVDAAEKLKKAAELAASYGLRVKVWDAYRPYTVQKELRRYVSDPQWIAQGISNHNRGEAVDVTLVDRSGGEVDMGTGFDSFSPRAHYAATGLTPAQANHRKILRNLMMDAGFKPISTEWWHFDATGSRQHAAVDVSI